MSLTWTGRTTGTETQPLNSFQLSLIFVFSWIYSMIHCCINWQACQASPSSGRNTDMTNTSLCASNKLTKYLLFWYVLKKKIKGEKQLMFPKTLISSSYNQRKQCQTAENIDFCSGISSLHFNIFTDFEETWYVHRSLCCIQSEWDRVQLLLETHQRLSHK